MFLAAVGGAISYVRRSRMNESPLALRLGNPGRRRRALLGLLLCGTAVLAPAYQVHLGTVVSLFKHVGFGLLFAAPMAGVGVTRLVGAHFRYPQLGIMLWTAMLCLGIQQADWRFDVWLPVRQVRPQPVAQPFRHGVQGREGQVPHRRRRLQGGGRGTATST